MKAFLTGFIDAFKNADWYEVGSICALFFAVFTALLVALFLIVWIVP